MRYVGDLPFKFEDKPLFKAGDIVVCLHPTETPLEKGHSYIVEKIELATSDRCWIVWLKSHGAWHQERFVKINV